MKAAARSENNRWHPTDTTIQLFAVYAFTADTYMPRERLAGGR